MTTPSCGTDYCVQCEHELVCDGEDCDCSYEPGPPLPVEACEISDGA